MDFEHFPTVFLIVVIGCLGEVFKALSRAKAGDTGWRGVYYVTYRAHGIPVGAVVGVLAVTGGVNIPETFGTSAIGGALWGAGCGALAMALYTMTMGIVHARVKHLAARADEAIDRLGS